VDAKSLYPTNFKLVISYVIPGFTVLQGLPFLMSQSENWGILDRGQEPTISGFLSGSLEALATGLIVSSIRWLLVDTFHNRTGVKAPKWDFAKLEARREAFELIIEAHYDYYKFHANMAVATFWLYFSCGRPFGWLGLKFLMLFGLFFLSSRDCLKKYYVRSGRLLEED
jgi:hypothetical protein